jgi:hypothetical protein
VRVSIANGVSHVIWSARRPVIAIDAGALSLVDGKLISESKRQASTFTLFQSHGKPRLFVEAMGRDGDQYYAELLQDKP